MEKITRSEKCTGAIVDHVPYRRRMLQIIWSETQWPRLANEPAIRSHPSAGVFSCQPENQCFCFLVDAWPTGIDAMFRAVQLAGDKPTVPSQDRIWFRDAGHLPQLDASESLADLGECEPLRIGEADPSGKT